MTAIAAFVDACKPTLTSQISHKNAVVGMNQDGTSVASQRAENTVPAKRQAEFIRLLFGKGCELIALQHPDGTPVDLKAFEIKFDPQCKLHSFSHRSA